MEVRGVEPLCRAGLTNRLTVDLAPPHLSYKKRASAERTNAKTPVQSYQRTHESNRGLFATKQIPPALEILLSVTSCSTVRPSSGWSP